MDPRIAPVEFPGDFPFHPCARQIVQCRPGQIPFQTPEQFRAIRFRFADRYQPNHGFIPLRDDYLFPRDSGLDQPRQVGFCFMDGHFHARNLVIMT